MSDFKNQIQNLEAAGIQSNQATSWNTGQQFDYQSGRLCIGFGIGACFFQCFNCFRCGGCGGCARCFGCAGCAGCARCHGCARCG